MDSIPRRIVIIGGTAAGTSAAAAVARNARHHHVTLFEQNSDISIGSCSLPERIRGTVTDRRLFVRYTPAAFEERYGVSVTTGCRVTAIDRPHRRVVGVQLSTGEHFSEPFDRLLIATGSQPRRLAIPGRDAANIVALKTIDSAETIASFLETHHARSAVIIGGGTLGLTMADVFRSRGLSTTIIEQHPTILSPFDEDVAHRIETLIRSSGVKILTGCTVTEFNIRDDLCVSCDLHPSGEVLSADFVLEAIGVDPETTIARNCGLRFGSSGALAVDRFLRTSDWNIYAAGDCIEMIHGVTGKPGYFPRGSNAVKSGRIAGENIVGLSAPFPGVLNSTLVAFGDLQIGMTGLSSRAAQDSGLRPLSVDVVAPSRVHGYPQGAPLHCKLVFTAEGRLLGAQLFGTDGVQGRLQTCTLAIQEKVSIRDLALSDFAYHPPLSPPWDPLNIAARAAIRRLDGR